MTSSQSITQADYWNDQAGPKWVEHADALDAMLKPYLDELIKRAKLTASDRVLDIGCGAGALTLAAAEQASHATGVDVSEPLLDLANRRSDGLASVDFLHADAATLTLKGATPYDVVISRFGVMFFDDPVSAFANIKALTSRPASLIFVCWRAPQFNPWATLPMQVAAPLLREPLPTPDPTKPGPFAFADRGRLRSILTEAGWPNIEINAVDVDMVLPGDSASEAASFMLKMGPLSTLLEKSGLSPDTVLTPLTNELSAQRRADGRVACGGSAWVVEASA